MNSKLLWGSFSEQMGVLVHSECFSSKIEIIRQNRISEIHRFYLYRKSIQQRPKSTHHHLNNTSTTSSVKDSFSYLWRKTHCVAINVHLIFPLSNFNWIEKQFHVICSSIMDSQFHGLHSVWVHHSTHITAAKIN